MRPRCLALRFPLWLLIAATASCSGPREPTHHFPEPLPTPASASLLRRVAGIADAFRTGDTIYIVISDSFPHPVAGVFSDSALADSVAGDAGPTYGVLRTSTPPGEDADADAVILPGCYKHRYTTQFICPLAAYQIPQDSVAEVELIIRTTGGDSLVVTVPGDSAAAFILTLEAYDKFIVPYYTSVFGVEYVAAERLGLVAALRDPPAQP